MDLNKPNWEPCHAKCKNIGCHRPYRWTPKRDTISKLCPTCWEISSKKLMIEIQESKIIELEKRINKQDICIAQLKQKLEENGINLIESKRK